MSSSLSHVFASTEEHARELPMSPYVFGGIAMLAFLALLGVLWFFRGVGAKVASGSAHGQGTDHRPGTDHQGSHH